MFSSLKSTACAYATLQLLIGCAGGTEPAEGRAERGLRGAFPGVAPGSAEGRVLEFSSVEAGPLVADVQLRVGTLLFDAHFDYGLEYGQAQVVTDGHGLALDREAHALLRDATAAFAAAPPTAGAPAQTDQPTPAAPFTAEGISFEQRALFAALVVWQESGGIPLFKNKFALPDTSPSHATEKSVSDDGVTCITRGAPYAVSFDYGGTTVNDKIVTADAYSCNGLCGPACVPLTLFQSWTLDCLEHDECCAETDSGPDCWVPLGECGDEYERAVSDFLLGVDLFADHCSG